jgi:hypothetical protein
MNRTFSPLLSPLHPTPEKHLPNTNADSDSA